MTCQQLISGLMIGFGTAFWLWYLVEEGNLLKGKRPRRWYERDLFDKRDEQE